MNTLTYLRTKAGYMTESQMEEEKGRYADPWSVRILDPSDVIALDIKILGGYTNMVNIADISVTTLETIKAYGLDGTPRFILDELQNARIANTQEKEDVTGKGGRKLNSLKKNKAVTISGTNGLVSGGLLEAQTGGVFEAKASTPVAWTDYLTINSDKATTNYKAVGTAGAEIEGLYIKNSNGTMGTKLDQAATASTGKFAYNPANRELSFAASAYEDGTEIVVFYTRNIAGSVITNEAEKYSEKLTLYIDAFGEDLCGKQYRIQFYVPRADFSGDFDIELGDNQTVHAFEAESLSGGSCGANSTGGALWTYTIFDGDAEDSEATDVYTVSFNANGHGTAPATQNVASGGKATEPSAPTADGYTFGGWYKEAACTNAWTFGTDTVTGNITLFAKWTQA